jgi:hypothetical protein
MTPNDVAISRESQVWKVADVVNVVNVVIINGLEGSLVPTSLIHYLTIAKREE